MTKQQRNNNLKKMEDGTMMTNSNAMKATMRNDVSLVGKELELMENAVAAIRTVRVEGIMTGETEVRVRFSEEGGKGGYLFMTKKVMRMLAHGRMCDMCAGGSIWCPECA